MVDHATPANTPTWPQRVALAAGAIATIAALLFIEDLGGGFLNHLLLYLPGVDKVMHVVQSGLLLLVIRLLVRRVSPGVRYPTAIAASLTVMLAGLDEVQQSFTRERTVEFADIVASTCGAAVAVGALRRRWQPTVAALLIGAGLLGGAIVTYLSWERLHDVNYALRMEGAGRFADARRAYHRAIAAGHTSGGIYNGAAWMEIESGDGDAAVAVDWAQRALTLQPDDADTMDTLGWALYHDGRTEEAYGLLTQALARKPGIYCIHYHLAMVLLRMQRPAEALAHLQRQIADWPQARESERAQELLARDATLRALVDQTTR